VTEVPCFVPLFFYLQVLMNYRERIITDIECHSVEGIMECFSHGVNPNDTYRDQPLFFELTSEYARTGKFKECVKAFIDAGLQFETKELLAVLADDVEMLTSLLQADSTLANKRYTLRCAFTPLLDVTLLHICAEFNHFDCAKKLLKWGAKVNAAAGVNADGFGGQTPIFHTVNQPHHNSREMMDFLLENDAKLDITVPGIIWGQTYPWETLIPSVNPISYSMMGLLPQMHRNEKTITEVVVKLLKHAYKIDYAHKNVPNAYLLK